MPAPILLLPISRHCFSPCNLHVTKTCDQGSFSKTCRLCKALLWLTGTLDGQWEYKLINISARQATVEYNYALRLVEWISVNVLDPEMSHSRNTIHDD